MTAPNKRYAFSLAALALSACAVHEVGVGDAQSRASSRIDLSACYGAQTHCEATKLEVPRKLELPGTTFACPAASEQPLLDPEWTAVFPSSSPKVALSPDGSLWIADEGFDRSRAGAIVERYSRQGERLVESELLLPGEHDSVISTVDALALDDRGHAFIALATAVADQERGWAVFKTIWIIELDVRGEQVGLAIEVPDVSDLSLSVARDGTLVVSATKLAGHAALGRLRSDRTVAWVQTNTTQRFLTKTSCTEHDRVFVIGRSAQVYPDTGADAGSLALYDAHGNLRWDIDPGMSRDSGDFVLAADGGVVIAGDFIAPAGDPRRLFVGIHKLNEQGELVWSGEFGRLSSGTGTLGSDTDGNVYLVVDQEGRSGIRKVSADGRTCASMPWSGDFSVTKVLPAPDGSLFFAADSFTESTTIGVLVP